MSNNCSLKTYKNFSNEILNNLKDYIIELENYFKNSSLIQEIDNYLIVISRIDDDTLYDPKKFKDNNYIYKGLEKEYNNFHTLFKKIDEDLNKIINFSYFPTKKSNYLNLDNNSSSIKENIIFNDDNSEEMTSYINFINNNNVDNADVNDDKMKDLYYIKTNQKDREYFLNLMINFIKYILLKCDKVIKTNEDSKIIKKKEYENIQNYYYLEFLIDINKNEDEIKIDDFSLINLNKDIIEKFEDAFKKNEEPKLEKYFDNFYEEDNYEDYVDEVYNGNSKESDEIKRKKEKIEIDEGTINHFYYLINIIPKNNSKFNENIKKQIENILKVKINPSNFLVLNNNKNNIDFFVKSNFFFNLSFEQIKYLYLNLREVYEYRNIVEFLINECNIKNNIDLAGNFIIKINEID
jgi:hypothetical protein